MRKVAIAAGLALMLSGCAAGHAARDGIVGPVIKNSSWFYPEGWVGRNYLPGDTQFEDLSFWERRWNFHLASFQEAAWNGHQRKTGEWGLRILLGPPGELPAVFRIERSPSGALLTQKTAKPLHNRAFGNVESARVTVENMPAQKLPFKEREARISAEAADKLLDVAPLDAFCARDGERFLIFGFSDWQVEYTHNSRTCVSNFASHTYSGQPWQRFMEEMLPHLGYSKQQITRFVQFH
ncbi:hypothetical protein [Leisingera sp. ANG-Vp]|uniref:hypothetical protein n=1 Tax=Leisingera sp. ANG-Vp TaxID=1577896 RepID=UPI00057E8B25|nr:hypothetical protein [Leisingera sp. ANG-Vp]KIC21654.1 hypothetical protein RA20_03280 [Leisingera sp. ANG-Vp]